MNRLGLPHFGYFLCALAVAAGCGGGGASLLLELSNALVLERHRALGTGNITPVLSESGLGFDGAEVDSPSVADDAGRPGGDRFLLYYEGTSVAGTSTIGVVSSAEEDFDVLAVARTQVIGLGQPGSGFEAGATDPMVIVDKSVPFNSAGRYMMWFEGRSGPAGNTSSIIFATSPDGVNWGNFTICLGLSASFASVRVADPVVVEDGALLKMWFEAVDTVVVGVDGPATIGYADSTDGINWTVRDAAGNTGLAAGPVFLVGAVGNFDGYSVNAPAVVIDEDVAVGVDGRFKLWFEAADTPGNIENTIGYATSADGLTWSNPGLPVMRPSSDSIAPLPFDSGDLEHPCVLIDRAVPTNTVGRYRLWYTGDAENNVSPNRIGLARGRDGP